MAPATDRSFSLRDVFEAGAQFTELSRERAQRFVERLVSEGRLTQSQASDAVTDVIDWSKERATSFRTAVQAELDDRITQLRLPTREDFVDLERRVEEIARTVAGRIPAKQAPVRRSTVTAAAPATKKATTKKAASKKAGGKKDGGAPKAKDKGKAKSDKASVKPDDTKKAKKPAAAKSAKKATAEHNEAS